MLFVFHDMRLFKIFLNPKGGMHENIQWNNDHNKHTCNRQNIEHFKLYGDQNAYYLVYNFLQILKFAISNQ